MIYLAVSKIVAREDGIGFAGVGLGMPELWTSDGTFVNGFEYPYDVIMAESVNP
jgi:hypothetical protein